jgi:hypothetical protein
MRIGSTAAAVIVRCDLLSAPSPFAILIFAMSGGRSQRNLVRCLADEKSAEIAGCTNEISQLENLLAEVEAKRARLTAELDALIGRPARTSGDVSSTPSPDQYRLAMKKARLTLTRTIGTQTEPAKSQTEPEQ